MFYLLSPRMFLKRPKKVSAIALKGAATDDTAWTKERAQAPWMIARKENCC